MGSRQLTGMTPFRASPAKCRGESRPHGDLRMGRPAAAPITLLSKEGRREERREEEGRGERRGEERRGKDRRGEERSGVE